MATLLVLVEASPHGIHPGSALALCVARDLASYRGATVVASTPPQTPPRDAQVLAEVIRRGADRMVFCTVDQLLAHLPAMAPRCILGPATDTGRASLMALGHQDLTIAWVQGPAHPPANLEGTLAVMAGALPWYELHAEIIPEYPGDDQLGDLRQVQAAKAPALDNALRFIIDPALDDPKLRAELELLGAKPLESEADWQDPACIPICIGPSLPPAVQPLGRSILIPGHPDQAIQSDWGRADWVLPGSAYDAVRNLHTELWSPYVK